VRRDQQLWLLLLCTAGIAQLSHAFGLCPGGVPFSFSPALRANAHKSGCVRFMPALSPALGGAMLRGVARSAKGRAPMALRMSGDDPTKWSAAEVGTWLEKEGFNPEWQKSFSGMCV
jgi:hypothetical protein